jgi:hypothetical protein
VLSWTVQQSNFRKAASRLGPGRSHQGKLAASQSTDPRLRDSPSLSQKIFRNSFALFSLNNYDNALSYFFSPTFRNRRDGTPRKCDWAIGPAGIAEGNGGCGRCWFGCISGPGRGSQCLESIAVEESERASNRIPLVSYCWKYCRLWHGPIQIPLRLQSQGQFNILVKVKVTVTDGLIVWQCLHIYSTGEEDYGIPGQTGQ